ncbi:MAG: hypothetical protein FJ356_00740 [Thaumarchaeota archaeon]|nr:hypothetical protein [Nitrososphaerota archaeon]
MAQIRIVCFAHPKEWTILKEKNNIIDNLLGIKNTSSSWVKRNETKGKRNGIYSKPYTVVEKRFVSIPFVWEKILKSSNQSIEMLLDNVKPKNNLSEPLVYAVTSKIIIDTTDGIGYVIDNSKDIQPFEKLEKFFKKLEKDTSILLSHSKLFAWDKNRVEDFTAIATEEGFTPYKIRGLTDLVKIVAEGDLINDEDWNRMQSALRNRNWTTVAFLHNHIENKFVFGLLKGRNVISVKSDKTQTTDEIFLSRIIMIRRLFEKTLGMTLNQYCFSEFD